MRDNSLDADSGSELSPRSYFVALPALRVPQSIDGDPYEVAKAALREDIDVLTAMIAHGEDVERMVRNAMLEEAFTLDEGAAYPDRTYELQATRRANKATGIALDLFQRALRELELPAGEARRV